MSVDLDPPPVRVRVAFGGHGGPDRLRGGRGSAWRVGDLVLKPLDMLPAAIHWYADALSTVASDEVRLPTPLRSLEGSLVVDGWCAWPFVEGRHEARQWPAIIDAGDRLHRALVGIRRPAFLDLRTDRWAVGDRVAWGETDSQPFVNTPHISRLMGHLEPITVPNQLVHGDLTGNVLFAISQPPAVIDVSPYWRPPGFAAAVVIADALVWEGADESVLAAVAHIDPFGQFLARALIYRIVSGVVQREAGAIDPNLEATFQSAVDLACRLCARG